LLTIGVIVRRTSNRRRGGRHPGSFRPCRSTMRRSDGFIRRAHWVRLNPGGRRRTTIFEAVR